MFSFLDYDVHGAGRNPSKDLRRLGARITGSVWLVRTDRIPQATVARLTRDGATWHLSPLATDASATMAQRAIDCLNAALLAQIESAHKSLANGPKDQSMKEAELARNRHRNAVRELNKLVTDTRIAAEALGVDVDQIKLATGREALAELTREAARLATAYLAAAESLPEADPIRKAAERNEVPAEILADYAQDNGDGAGLVEALAVPQGEDVHPSDPTPVEAPPRPPVLTGWDVRFRHLNRPDEQAVYIGRSPIIRDEFEAEDAARRRYGAIHVYGADPVYEDADLAAAS